MKILHVCAVYPPFTGGAATYAAEISRRFAAEGHDVSALSTDIGSIDLTWSPRGRRVGPAQEVIDAVNVIRLPVRHLPLAPYSFYALRRLMPMLANIAPLALLRSLGDHVPRTALTPPARALLAQPFDLVHVINITMEGLLQRAARASDATPLLCTPFVHIGAPDVMRNYVMPHQIALMRRAQTVFAQTGLEADALVRHGLQHDAIVTTGMGVNPDEARGADGGRFRAAHGVPTGAPLIGFMGSVTRDKGAITLLEALQPFWEGADAQHAPRLVLAGEVPGPGGFDAAYARLPAAQRPFVIQTGVLHGAAKHDMLAALDVFALPSRVDAFGIVILEAWLHRKPVIGADAGGIPDVIAHDRDGLITPFGDARALRDAIRALLDAPERRHAMGQAGHQKVLARYTWDIIYAQLRAVYLRAARRQ